MRTHNLVPYLTALENLEMIVGMIAGNPGGWELRRRSRQLLEDLGLDGRGGHLPPAVSVSERRRVAVVMVTHDQRMADHTDPVAST